MIEEYKPIVKNYTPLTMYERPYHTIDLSSCTFLVTGGAGFIGSNIVEYLLKYGAGKVRVLDNFSTGLHSNIEAFGAHPAFELLHGDIRNMDDCRKAMKGIDYVSHQAALGSVPRSLHDPLTTNEVNICGFLNVLVTAREAGVKRLVYAASSSTYGDNPELPKTEEKIGNPLSPYAVTKYTNELYAGVFSRVYGFHTLGLRYFNVFGPRQHPKGPYAAVIPLFIESALKNVPAWINGNGEITRDFTFVENAVQANIKAMLLPEVSLHMVMNIAFGEQITLNQLWQYITRIVGIDLPPRYRQEREGDIRHSLANIRHAQLTLGYQPLFSAQEGLKEAVKWYLSSLINSNDKQLAGE